jgi:tetratricopeptide (TPR) repeat protein
MNLANGETFYNLAEFNFSSGNTKRAMLFYDRSIELGFLQAYLRKARLLEITGNSEKAFQLLQKAESLNPEDSRVNAERGVILARQKQFQKAVDEFQKALQKDPESKHLLYNIGVCYYRMGEEDRARGYLKEFLRVVPVGFNDERAEATQMLEN